MTSCILAVGKEGSNDRGFELPKAQLRSKRGVELSEVDSTLQASLTFFSALLSWEMFMLFTNGAGNQKQLVLENI